MDERSDYRRNRQSESGRQSGAGGQSGINRQSMAGSQNKAGSSGGGIKDHKTAQEEREYAARRARRNAARKKRRRKRQIQRAILIAAMVLILILLILGIRAIVRAVSGGGKEPAQTTSAEVKDEKKDSKKSQAVITIAGDIVTHQPFLESTVYYDGENYDYTDIFKYIKDDYEAADFSAVTTEYSLTGENYSGYPTFCAPDAMAQALADNGMDMCLLANNHIYDGGDDGLQRTMDTLTDIGLSYTGVRKTDSDKKYIVQEINGIKVGFFNYVTETEGTEGTKTINGITVSDDSADLINSFDEADPQSLYDEVKAILADMKDEGVEYTIACMHWGTEYQTTENENQDAIAQELCDLGVDALIGSHPHVIQPMDLLQSTDGDHQMVCAYAIGNHLSNQRTEYMEGYAEDGYTEDGMMVTLTINRDKKGNISLKQLDVTPTWVYHDQDTDDEYFILPLDDADNLEETTGLTDLTTDVEDSLKRTNGIISDGLEKIQEALPIARE